MFCHQCGKENTEDAASFCVKCGSELANPAGNSPKIEVQEGTKTSTVIGLLVVVALIVFALPLGILAGLAFWAWKRPRQRRLIIWVIFTPLLLLLVVGVFVAIYVSVLASGW